MKKEAPSNKRTCFISFGIGAITAVSLYGVIYTMLSIFNKIYENNTGSPIVFGYSLVWTIIWVVIFMAIVWKGKPRLIEWLIPFTFILCSLFIDMAAATFHPDTPEQLQSAIFSQIIFRVCFCIWGITALLGLVRWVLISLGIESSSINKDS